MDTDDGDVSHNVHIGMYRVLRYSHDHILRMVLDPCISQALDEAMPKLNIWLRIAKLFSVIGNVLVGYIQLILMVEQEGIIIMTMGIITQKDILCSYV